MVMITDRARILTEVGQRIMNKYGHEDSICESTIFDTLYEERKRIDEGVNQFDAGAGVYYNQLFKKTLHCSPEERRELLRELIDRFAQEIVGDFDPHIYSLTAKVIPPALGMLLHSLSPLSILNSMGYAKKITDHLTISGDVDGLKRVSKLGTVILLPTHVSNLDSIVIGYGLHSLNLPPFTYGAGLNLFSNRLLGFFMRNLGAYKIDRRKKAGLYKDVLKTYAGCTIEMGYHNLFFPEGTRSRSGRLEPKIKKGLLGMGLNAYINNLRKKTGGEVYVVPCTLNYQLVLEAETLIDDFLMATGKSRFIIEDDEFSQPRRILEFVKGLFRLDSNIHWVLGAPLDVFGNQIDLKGRSLDYRGRPINRRRYVLDGDKPVFDTQRDSEYTEELAASVYKSWVQNTVINSTQVVAYVTFQKIIAQNPGIDFYRLLRTGGVSTVLKLKEVYKDLERLLEKLKEWNARSLLQIDHSLAHKDAIFIMSEALSHLSTYHQHIPLLRKGDRLLLENRRLLYYYQNRLASIIPSHEV